MSWSKCQCRRALQVSYRKNLFHVSLGYLTETKTGKEQLQYLLDLKSEGPGEAPSLKGYRATLLSQGNPGEEAKAVASCYFKVLGDFSDITATEAHNLLCGRDVLKFVAAGGNTYTQQWVVLVKVFPGVAPELVRCADFDLNKLLDPLPLRELQNVDTSIPFISSLQYGNLTAATLVNNGKDVPVFICVDAVQQEILCYDTNGQKTSLEALLKGKVEKTLQKDTPTLKPRVLKRLPDNRSGKGRRP